MNPFWSLFPWFTASESKWGGPPSSGGPTDLAGSFVRALLAAGQLDDGWLIEGARQQIAFWTAVERHLTASGARSLQPPLADIPVLAIRGRHGDRELLATFRVQNPTGTPLEPSFALEPLRSETGAVVTDEVLEIPRVAGAPAGLAPGETREITMLVHADRLPGPGTYRGRMTVRSPVPRHLALELHIDP